MDKKIFELIDESITALEQRDALKLRRVSAEAISEAAIEQHRELIMVGLVDYALSKILSKTHYEGISDEFYKKILDYFRAAKEEGEQNLLKNLEKIEDIVIKLDKSEGRYEEDIMQKARVKKAVKLYYSGLSLKRASELTGANPSEVLNLAGHSKIHEFKDGGPLSERLKITREVFK